MADFSYAETGTLGAVIAVVLGGAGAALASSVLIPALSERVLPAAKETRLADFLPFDSILPDGMTVSGKDETLSRFIAISGIDQSFIREEEAHQLYQARKRLFDSIAETGATLRIFTIRDPAALPFVYNFPNPIADEIARKWNSRFTSAFRTRSIIAVSVKPSRDSMKRLAEAIQIAESTLAKYQPKVLSQNPSHSPDGDMTIGSLLGQLVSPLSRPRPKAFGNELSSALVGDEVTFKRNGHIRFRNGNDTKWCSVIGLRRLGDDTNTAMASDLAAMPCEMTVLQTVDATDRGKATLMLKQQQAMMVGTSGNPAVFAQYQTALHMIEGIDDTKASLCYFSEVIFLYANTEQELDQHEKTCRQILTNHGVSGVVERGAAQASWFGQFPGYDTKPRYYRLMSNNVALLSTFDKAPAGQVNGPIDWGKGPIAPFTTGSGTAYSFQFHLPISDPPVGHGLAIAGTGVGKTTLFSFLSLMASRHRHARQYLFDRYFGVYPYTTAMGGSYINFNNDPLTLSVSGGMNPLDCEPTRSNTEFLKLFFQAISGCSSEEDLEQISYAIDIAFSSYKRHERSIERIYQAAFQPGSTLAKSMRKWVDKKMYGGMFNAPRCSLDPEAHWLTAFDMTKVLEDSLLGSATVAYITHKIKEALVGKRIPAFLFIDETRPLLNSDSFKEIYKIMLREFRKLSGSSVISVFQGPDSVESTGIADTIREQCGTWYLFPNGNSNIKSWANYGLTDRELGFLLGHTQPARRVERGMLIKRPQTNESVIVDVDLSVLGSHLRIFSSSSRNVGLASDLQRQFGEGWVQRYVDYEAP